MIVNFFTFLTIPNGVIKGSGIWHAIVSAIAKPIISLIYRTEILNSRSQILSRELVNSEVVVSLTTFGTRLRLLRFCLESIFRQTVRPDRVVLWLAESEFGDTDLPAEIVAYLDRGLEIHFCEDLRSHKKYWGAMREWPDAIVITLDDDTFYPENTIEDLLVSYLARPDAISCHRAHEMRFSDGNLLPYTLWNFASPGLTGPSLYLVPIGVGGVLYPPGSLADEVLDTALIKKLCFFADDLWLKVHSYRKGTPVVKVRPYSRSLISIPQSQFTTLTKQNVLSGGNDVQLKRVLAQFGVTFATDGGMPA